MTASLPVLAEHITPVADLRESNDALRDPDELRRRMNENGYLFIRKLQKPDAILQVRREMLDICAENGWLDPAAQRMDGIYSGRQPYPRYPYADMKSYRKMVRLPAFNGLAVSREVIGFFTGLFGNTVLTHARNIMRVTFPGHVGETTQPHQDFWYIKGTPETYTTWTPLGDCPRELGSLAILEGSHKQGPLQHRDAIGAGGSGVSTEKTGMRWLAADFGVGDVLIFHGYTVHAGLDHRMPDRLRLSVDFRYQRADHPIDASSMREHLASPADYPWTDG